MSEPQQREWVLLLPDLNGACNIWFLHECTSSLTGITSAHDYFTSKWNITFFSRQPYKQQHLIQRAVPHTSSSHLRGGDTKRDVVLQTNLGLETNSLRSRSCHDLNSIWSWSELSWSLRHSILNVICAKFEQATAASSQNNIIKSYSNAPSL